MANNIFKSIFAVIGIGLVVVLYLISIKIGNQRYLPNSRDGISIVDTRNGKVYVYLSNVQKWALVEKDGKLTRGVTIPDN